MAYNSACLCLPSLAEFCLEVSLWMVLEVLHRVRDWHGSSLSFASSESL